jgi:guanosine-3',5'-bis(diphosphate) 3'-pyrophosphohydrolase
MVLAPAFAAFCKQFVEKCGASELSRLERAWALALCAHEGQTRSSGEPYATHPLAVASILLDLLDPDADALCAALLHDVVEDSDVPLSRIASQFGSDVARIVDGVSKLDAIKASSPTHAKDETLRKLADAGGRDWRVFAVKLCDRLHNMRTLGVLNFDKRQRVALETHRLFFPLARYVGFYAVASELEALCLRFLYPWRWRIISKWVVYREAIDLRRSAGIFDAGFSADEFACASKLSAVRDRRIVDSFQRLAKERSVRALFSMPTFTLSCPSMGQAYRRICEFHRHFVFVPSSFNSDASEGLVSTKVLLSAVGPVVELIVEFPRVARKPWVRLIGNSASTGDFAALARASSYAGQFTQVLRELVADKSIVVFSPKGLRISLPHRSTGYDFAFAIHTELGLRASAMLVNGVRRDPTTELVSGDIVEIVSSDDVIARAEWEPFLRSPRSKAKLRQWLKELARAHSIELGRNLLNEAFLQFDWCDSPESVIGAGLLSSFGVESSDALFQRIGEGLISPSSVSAFASNPQLARVVRQSAGMGISRSIVLDGRQGAGVKYCGVCRPLPGDEIVCSLSPSGAVVHRLECSDRAAKREYWEEIVPTWAPVLVAPLPCVMRVEALDRRGLLAACAYVISDSALNVVGVSSRSYVELGESLARLEFSVLIPSATAARECVHALSLVVGVRSVVRI